MDQSVRHRRGACAFGRDVRKFWRASNPNIRKLYNIRVKIKTMGRSRPSKLLLTLNLVLFDDI